MENRLQEIRKSKKLSVLKLSQISKVSRPTIRKLENGEVETVKLCTLRALADALECKVTDFFIE